MKKVLVTSILAASFCNVAFAGEESNLKVTLGGDLNTQVGGVSQKKEYRQLDPNTPTSAKLSKYAVVNDTALKINIDGEAEGFKYGGLIKLKADTSKNKYQDSDGNATQVMGYVETMFGKLEMGSYRGVASAMRVDAGSIAAATGGVRGDSRFWWNGKRYNNTNNSESFLEQPTLLSDLTDYSGRGSKKANAAKISYFTPSFSGFTLGVSYTPDLDKNGTVNNATVSNDVNGTYKNIWQAAVRYDVKMNDWDLKAYLGGETGQKKAPKTSDYKRLQGVEGGVAVSYMGFNFAGSYGSQFKSGALKTAANIKNTNYWTLGAGYNYSGIGASVTYFEGKKDAGLSSKKTNKLQNVVVGVDYALAPGFMPYAEVAFFNLKDATAKEAKKVSNKGQVYLVGTKLSF